MNFRTRSTAKFQVGGRLLLPIETVVTLDSNLESQPITTAARPIHDAVSFCKLVFSKLVAPCPEMLSVFPLFSFFLRFLSLFLLFYRKKRPKNIGTLGSGFGKSNFTDMSAPRPGSWKSLHFRNSIQLRRKKQFRENRFGRLTEVVQMMQKSREVRSLNSIRVWSLKNAENEPFNKNSAPVGLRTSCSSHIP